MPVVILFLGSYLLGAVPFGLVIGRVFFRKDVRQFGSGNIGTSNVLRTLGTVPAIVVLFLDAGKAALPVILGKPHGSAIALIAGMLAILGHTWSVFLKFKGGKGIASTLGALIAFAPSVALSLVGVWGAIVATTRIISLGSVTAALALPVMLWLFGYDTTYIVGGAFITVFAVFTHRSNIARLLKGEEYKIGQRAADRKL